MCSECGNKNWRQRLKCNKCQKARSEVDQPFNNTNGAVKDPVRATSNAWAGESKIALPSDADGELMSAMKRVSDQDAQIDELKKQVAVLAAEKQRRRTRF